MSAALAFYASHVRVEVSTDLPEVAQGVSSVWGNARAPLVPTTRTARFWAGIRGLRFEVKLDGTTARTTEQSTDVLAQLESVLFDALRTWHAQQGLFRAACVTGPAGTLVFAGASSAGKGSLTRAAIARGYRYATDELTVVDGDRLWGIQRALQYEPSALEAALPAWRTTADRTTHPLRASAVRRLGVPLLAVPASSLIHSPLTAARARLVLLERSHSTSVTRLDVLHSLSVLRQAQLNASAAGLALVRRRAWRLRWDDPDRAFAMLEARLLQDA